MIHLSFVKIHQTSFYWLYRLWAKGQMFLFDAIAVTAIVKKSSLYFNIVVSRSFCVSVSIQRKCWWSSERWWNIRGERSLLISLSRRRLIRSRRHPQHACLLMCSTPLSSCQCEKDPHNRKPSHTTNKPQRCRTCRTPCCWALRESRKPFCMEELETYPSSPPGQRYCGPFYPFVQLSGERHDSRGVVTWCFFKQRKFIPRIYSSPHNLANVSVNSRSKSKLRCHFCLYFINTQRQRITFFLIFSLYGVWEFVNVFDFDCPSFIWNQAQYLPFLLLA